MLSAVPVTSNCPVRRPAATAGWDWSAWQCGAQPGELGREGGAPQWALSPLGLGSTHTRVSPMAPSCGPTAAPGRPNAAR